MQVTPREPSSKGPAEWFTGDVWMDPVVRGGEPPAVNVNSVHFTPGSRTAWHSHDGGQTLYVTEGRGLVQARGEAVQEIRAGDIVHTAHLEEHWHGARPDAFMTHLSITEGGAHFGPHVTDAEYLG